MTVSRNYTSPLREQQMAQTRELILDGAIELLGDTNASELTVAAAAERAGVSVRTAYRYFPTIEALYDAVNDWFMRRWGPAPRYPERLDGLADLVNKLHQSFAEHDTLMRAAMRTTQGGEVRARRKQQQSRALQKMIEAEGLDLTPEQVRCYAGAIHIIISADNYLNLRGVWGLSVEEAIASAQFAIAALVARIRKGGS